jgi:hypothetical protein
VGNTIEDTIPSLRQQWFGLIRGLHIDSYKAIRHVDGYAIELIAGKSNDTELQQTMDKSDHKLWFINLGGYNSESLQEQHHFNLVVASNKQAAKYQARRRWLDNALQIHKDDIHNIATLESVDNCLPLFNVDGWQIHLKAEERHHITDLKPDWFGYWRIDGTVPKPRPNCVSS